MQISCENIIYLFGHLLHILFTNRIQCSIVLPVKKNSGVSISKHVTFLFSGDILVSSFEIDVERCLAATWKSFLIKNILITLNLCYLPIKKNLRNLSVYINIL